MSSIKLSLEICMWLHTMIYVRSTTTQETGLPTTLFQKIIFEGINLNGDPKDLKSTSSFTK